MLLMAIIELRQNLRPKVARNIGCTIPDDRSSGDMGEERGSKIPLGETLPAAEVAADLGLRGQVMRGNKGQWMDLVKWSP